MLRITHANTPNWLPQALRNALSHCRYRQRNPPQPQHPHKRRRRSRPHPVGPGDERKGIGGGQGPQMHPPAEPGPPTHAPPTVQREGGCGRDDGGNDCEWRPTAVQSTNR